MNRARHFNFHRPLNAGLFCRSATKPTSIDFLSPSRSYSIYETLKWPSKPSHEGTVNRSVSDSAALVLPLYSFSLLRKVRMEMASIRAA